MPKPSKYLDCFDEVEQITTTTLRKSGFLAHNGCRSGYLTWKRNGEIYAKVGITVNLPAMYAELSYVKSGHCFKYRVDLERAPAHFGGFNWYFICPKTGKRCRTLYCVDDLFLSRFAYPTTMYSKQKVSKNYRGIFSALTSVYNERDFLDQKYARTMYKGKFTKRYRRMCSKRSGQLSKHSPKPEDS